MPLDFDNSSLIEDASIESMEINSNEGDPKQNINQKTPSNSIQIKFNQ